MENLDFNIEHWQDKKCPPVNCRKKACECGLEKVFLSSALGDDSKDSPVAPKNGAYCNAIVVYEANNHVYIYSKEGIPTLVETGGDVEKIIEQLEDQLAQEILDRQAADNVLQGEIDDLKNSPDVVDIVPTYADLQAYDTSKLGDNDIVRVLADETHDGDSTYYRWNKQSETWTYIGGISITTNTIFYADRTETGDSRHIYKDKALTEPATAQDLIDANETGQVILRTDLSHPGLVSYYDYYLQCTGYDVVFSYTFTFLSFYGGYGHASYSTSSLSSSVYNYVKTYTQARLTAGSNITISSNTISATDTTYSNFTGATAQQAGTSGLVPAPATTDVDKFLKSDGTWDTAGGGGGDTVYSDKTTSNSSTGGAVYIGNLDSSQTEQADPTTTDNHYKYFWALPSSNSRIPKSGTVCILGENNHEAGVAIGNGASNQNNRYYGVAIGNSASVFENSGVAIGSFASCSAENSVSIGRQADIQSSSYKNSVALGSFAQCGRSGEININAGGTNLGYNSTNYRVIGGVHDGQDLHDAATVAQGNTLALAAPDTSTVGVLGQLWTDTTNMHTYQCTAISGSTYTWTMRW